MKQAATEWTVNRGADLIWVARLGDVEATGVTRQIACLELGQKIEALRLSLLANGATEQ